MSNNKKAQTCAMITLSPKMETDNDAGVIVLSSGGSDDSSHSTFSDSSIDRSILSDNWCSGQVSAQKDVLPSKMIQGCSRKLFPPPDAGSSEDELYLPALKPLKQKLRPMHVIDSTESDSDDKALKPLRKKRKMPSLQSTSHKCRHKRVTSDSEMDSPTKFKIHKKTVYLSDSEIVSPVKKKTKYLNDNPSIPIFEETADHYTAKKITEVLIDKTIPLTKIATVQPVCVQDNFVFIVDISKLNKPEDIRADDLGSWECNGKRCLYCSVDDMGYVVEVRKSKPPAGYHTYTLVRRYYKHATANDYKKTIAEIYDSAGDQLNRTFVQYSFSGKPHNILQKSHGNSKYSKPFVRAAPSTLQKLKDCRKKGQTPKQAISAITNEKGGIVNMKSAGEVPRNRRQVYNIKNTKNDDSDALLSVMAMCKESMGKGEDPFVRIVTSAPEPMCIMCTNSQLNDIERFCTDPDMFKLLSVDPTFNLGDFSVTVTSYCNLLLQSHRTGKNPVMIGPMLVHRRKVFSTYHFFASGLVSLNPALSCLQAFGTDGEECLYNAFSVQFTQAHHVRCFLHFRDNCKAKLSELKVSNDVALEIIQDIFGSLIKGLQGIVDASSADDLRSQFDHLQAKWDSIAPGFHSWFLEYKLHEVELSMLAPIRQAAGLGNPPEPFYTNEIESINRVIKRKTEYKSSEWPGFCKVARELISDQQNEIEKAVIGVGEYKFCDEFKHLQLPLTKWSSMTKLQRERYLQKIAKVKLHEAKASSLHNSSSSSGMEVPTSSKILSICGKCFNAQNCMLSSDILQNMFIKAEKLVLGTNSICPSPGSVNAKLVESKSGTRPHFVTVKAKYKYTCDSDCAMFKCAKICSHTIACAFIDNQLQPFISQAVTSPNLYELSKSGTAGNPGKKPCKRKASSKSTLKALTELKSQSFTSAATASKQSTITAPVHSISTVNVESIAAVTTSAPQAKAVNLLSVTSPSTHPAIYSSVSFSNISSQGTINSITSCSSVQVSNFVQSPVTSVTQVLPLAAAIVSTPVSCHQSDQATINQATNALLGIISQVISGSSTTGLSQSISSIDINYLFWIVFVCGNIARCQGCSGRIMRDASGKPLPPPDDLVIQHKEQVMFNNPNTGKYQLSRDYKNVYYHARLECVRQRFPTFVPIQHCRINRDTFVRFTQFHKDYIAKEFGLKALV